MDPTIELRRPPGSAHRAMPRVVPRLAPPCDSHQGTEVWQLAGLSPLLVRPIVPEDAPLLQTFVRALTEESRFARFHGAVKELPPRTLAALTRVDPRSSFALLALACDGGHSVPVAEARIAPAHERAGAADFALAVADGWQRRGLGARLLSRLVEAAAAAGYVRLEGEALRSNRALLRLVSRAGFALVPHPVETALVRVVRGLANCGSATRGADVDSAR